MYSPNVDFVFFFQTNGEQWKIVFFMTGGIYFLGNLIFIVFGSGKVQWWDSIEKSEKLKDDMYLRSRTSAIVARDVMVP